jgi:hypothetical protein
LTHAAQQILPPIAAARLQLSKSPVTAGDQLLLPDVIGIGSSTASIVSGSKGTVVGAMSAISSMIGGIKGDGIRGSDDRSSVKRYYCVCTKCLLCTLHIALL